MSGRGGIPGKRFGPYIEGVILHQGQNPGGARWCAGHGKLECTKQRRHGAGQCHRGAIRGTATCNHHSGRSREFEKERGLMIISAWNAMGRPQGEMIDHRTAVLAVLQMTWLRLATYGELLRRQIEHEGNVITDGATPADIGEQAGTDGLIGHRYGMGGAEGIQYRQSEEIRALVALEGQERDRLVKYAKAAHDMGISDRLTNLAEQWGDQVAGKVSLLIDDLGLTPDQAKRVPDLLTKHLGSIDLSMFGAGPAAAIEGSAREDPR